MSQYGILELDDKRKLYKRIKLADDQTMWVLEPNTNIDRIIFDIISIAITRTEQNKSKN